MNTEEIYSSFKKRLMYRKISNFVMPVGVILILASQVIRMVWVGALGGLIIAAGAALSLVFWKCPSCNNYLSMKYKPDSVTECEHCNTRLRD